MKANILVIEDEEDILELLTFHLKKNSYNVKAFSSTKNVKKFLKGIDLLIVDRNLKGTEGSLFIKELREEGFNEPVIYLSAKTRQEEIEEGFLSGGDDYITKPFNMNELLLRIKAILKRSKKKFEVLTYKDIIIKIKPKEVFINEKEVKLTKLEFKLLYEFIKNKNIVLSREYLLQNVWKDEEFFQDKTVNVAINRLKLKIDPKKKKNYINSIRGLGYKLC